MRTVSLINHGVKTDFKLGWRIVFEAVWPKYQAKLIVIGNNIESHTTLMSGEVSLANVIAAQADRVRALEHYERTQEFQQRQDFEAVETYVSPRMYDTELDRLRSASCSNTGRWLRKEESFCKWLDPTDRSTRLLWLNGIPGAGMFLENIQTLA